MKRFAYMLAMTLSAAPAQASASPDVFWAFGFDFTPRLRLPTASPEGPDARSAALLSSADRALRESGARSLPMSIALHESAALASDGEMGGAPLCAHAEMFDVMSR